MRFTSLAITALLSTLSVAETVDVQVVAVGKNPLTNETGLKYWPEKITAKPGTLVQFQFWAGNHTVTQSNFDNPCIPIGVSNSSIQGVKSGFQPVSASADSGNAPVFTILVKDEKPMWLYCGQGPHCKNGMAMVINENTGANATRSLENYKGLAAGAPAPGDGYPGGTPPSEGYPGGTPPSEGYPGGTPPSDGYPGATPPSDGYPGSTPPSDGYPGGTPPSDGYPGGTSPGGGATPPGPGTGSPADGSATPTPTPPPSAAGRTSVGMSSLLLALGASFLLL